MIETRGLRAFFELQAGVTRGEVPSLERADSRVKRLQARVEKLQQRLAAKERRVEQGRTLPATDHASVANAEGDVAHARVPAREAPVLASSGADPRDYFISDVVRDRTFADVGGLYGTHNEKLSVGHRHGARELTMIDVAPEEHEAWSAFSERMERLAIAPYSTVSADVMELAESHDPPCYDVVHCSGVLYHVPDPMRLLAALRRLTRRFLVLGSAVTATTVRTGEGTLSIPAAGMFFVPALRDREKAVLESYWRPFVGEEAFGLTREHPDWALDDFAPFWSLPTVGCMKAMAECAGFSYRGGSYYWNANAYAMLLAANEGEGVGAGPQQ